MPQEVRTCPITATQRPAFAEARAYGQLPMGFYATVGRSTLSRLRFDLFPIVGLLIRSGRSVEQESHRRAHERPNILAFGMTMFGKGLSSRTHSLTVAVRHR